MVTLLYSYFTNSLNFTFFILLLLLLEPLLKKHFSAVCLYRVWVVLMIGLLIPMRFEFTKALFYISSPRISVEDKAYYEFDVPGTNESNYSSDKFYISQKQSTQDTWNTYHNNAQGICTYFFKQLLPAKVPLVVQNRYLFLWIFWIIGVILLLTVKGIQYYRYIKQLKRFMSPINKEDLQEEFNQCIKEVHRNYTKYDTGSFSRYNKTIVCKCSIISSPMSIGIFKPIILLPNDSYLKKDLHFILRHELVHIRRRDSLVKLIRLIVLSFNWYNPCCYVLSRHLDNWCETSCDELVLYKSTKSDCLDYGRLLLKCTATQSKKNTTFLINLYGGKNNMKHRLASIMDPRKKHSGRLLLILLLFIISTTAIVATTNHKDVLASDNKELATADSTAVSSEEETSDDNESDLTINETAKNDFNVTVPIDVSATADSLRETAVADAIKAENTPYIWGGNDLSIGVDSSGFVQVIYKKIGYDLPRTSREQVSACEEVSMDNLLLGDLIFYASTDDNTVNHVGIYIGDNQIIHAKNARDGVIIQDINYRSPYCAGRIISD